MWQCHPRGEGGHPSTFFLAQIYQGLKSLVNGLYTLTNWPQNVICVHTCMQCGLMCGIWDLQSTIVEDLNDSPDPKHTLFCCKKVFVAICAFLSDNKCPLFTRLVGGFAERGHCHLFYRFFISGLPLVEKLCLATQRAPVEAKIYKDPHFTGFKPFY